MPLTLAFGTISGHPREQGKLLGVDHVPGPPSAVLPTVAGSSCCPYPL